MGLERVREVSQRLNLNPIFPVITVGGTNGKGSACAMLESIYQQAGYRVACYTSPHLLRYNERVRINSVEATDEELSAAFAAVELARTSLEQPVPLTYFEFGTLAAIWHFMQAEVDVAILEVGLGGRLDAVNAFEPSCAIVTSVDMDHMDFLGNTRESIGYEKAGIYRAGTAAICGDLDPPQSLLKHALAIGADLKQSGRNFYFAEEEGGWVYKDDKTVIRDLPKPALTGNFQRYNAACVLAAISAMQSRLAINQAQIAQGLRSVRLPGRFQQVASSPQVILDVAHNPHAAIALADNLTHAPCSGRTIAVFGMLADKDIAGVIEVLQSQIDVWYLSDIQHPRGAAADQLAENLRRIAPASSLHLYRDITMAYRQACNDAAENDRIIVFGSFFTVADVMRVLPAIPH